MIRLIERWLNDEPHDAALWHRWWKMFPVRLNDGRWSRSVGQLWRRRSGSGWEYQQDAETEDQWMERQR